MGVIPVDFILEATIREGFDYLKANPSTLDIIFAELKEPYLSPNYGQAKIDELKLYLASNDITIVQSLRSVPTSVPCVSINLAAAQEDIPHTGLTDFAGNIDTFNPQGELVDRDERESTPIVDNVMLGIHVMDFPDLVKYIYYMLLWVFAARKKFLIERQLDLTTFQATDLAQALDLLPENIYTRFITFTCTSWMTWTQTDITLLEHISMPDVGEHDEDEPLPDEGIIYGKKKKKEKKHPI